MPKSTPTTEQNNLALKVLLHDSREGFDARLVTPEQRDKLTYTDNTTRAWWLLPAFVVNNRYWCGWDVFYGHDIVVDLTTKHSYTGMNGVFQDDFVFLSDYYGYPDGNFYLVTV